MQVKKTMTARRYAELLRMAEAALDMHLNIVRNVGNCRKVTKFQLNDCLYMAVHFSIAGVEAFVNHLGYIFDDDWKNHERANFWEQYKRVIEILKNLGVDVSKIVMTPYAAFKKSKDTARNPFNHVHSSKHDVQSVEKDYLSIDAKKDWQESVDMLNSWLSISRREANSAYNEAILFIQYFSKAFKSNFFHSYILSEILNRTKGGVLIGDEERQHLLRRFIVSP